MISYIVTSMNNTPHSTDSIIADSGDGAEVCPRAVLHEMQLFEHGDLLRRPPNRQPLERGPFCSRLPTGNHALVLFHTQRHRDRRKHGVWEPVQRTAGQGATNKVPVLKQLRFAQNCARARFFAAPCPAVL